jgi:uncharacterized protein
VNQVIVGRAAEQRELAEAYASSQAEFVAVYGRRRVGKTFLVVNSLQPREGGYFQTTGIKNGPLRVQLERFAQELGRSFFKGAPLQVPGDWMRALQLLTDAIAAQLTSQKVVLFFDELPWLATAKSGMLSALEYFWNRHWANDGRIKLVVCGSSASWIMRKVIRSRGGLHNRVTRRINLKPFSLKETCDFLQHLGYATNHEQTLRAYMAVGGVPFYLKQFKKSQSVDQNISRLLFDRDGPLFDEFGEIFGSLFDEAEKYEELVKLVAGRHEGVFRQEIETRNKLTGKGGTLSRRLEDLEAAGFIASLISFGKKSRGMIYRLSDEYCYFYLKWVEPVKQQLKSDTEAVYWRSCLGTPRYHGWLGYAFENICYKHLAEIRKKLGITGFAPASSWRSAAAAPAREGGAEIDLLFDRDDDAITLCEIKFSDRPFLVDKKCAQALQRKRNAFIKGTRTRKQVFLAFIAAHGVDETLYADELIDDVVTLADLF